MECQMVYVIIDQEGNYIAPRDVHGVWSYVIFTGDCSGFVYYTDEIKATKRMDDLNLGNAFRIKHIDLQSIPKGNRIDNASELAVI